MIHIYRATRYPDRDFFTFQATDDTYQQFRFRFPVKVTEAKRGFEGGYFTYLRDDYRTTFFDLIKSYLRENYVPPELRLSAFRTDEPLSDLWPSPMWQQKVTDAVKAVFAEQGYAVNDDEFSEWVEVMPNRPSFSRDNVEIYWGVSFKVEVQEDRHALLWCKEQFGLFMDGKPTSLRQILQVHGEESTITQAIRHFTARSAEEQFGFLKHFVTHIPPLGSCGGVAFEREAITPQQIGMETWFWLHDSETHFETSNGLQTSLAQAILEEGSGFYSQPDDIQVIILLPVSDSSSVIPKIDWDQANTEAREFLKQVLPDVATPVNTIMYPIAGNLEGVIKEVQSVVQSHLDRRVLCLMVIPSPDARYSTDPILRSAEEQAFRLNKELRDLCRRGYATTVSWDKLLVTHDVPFIIHSALMGGLYRLNAEPWKLSNLPFETKPIEAVYFLGLVGEPESGLVSGVLFDYQGSLVAYGANIAEGRDLTVRDCVEDAKELAQSLVQSGIHRSRPQPVHIIFHVSPEMVICVEGIEAAMQAQPILCDIVLIDPGVTVGLWQPANRDGTPSHGIAVGSEALRIAYLMNTLSLAEKTSRGYVYPNPKTVKAQKLVGPTPMKTLAAHVYWLSIAHINALHRTVDTPISIAYARALCDHVSRIGRPMRVTRNYKRTLYWL